MGPSQYLFSKVLKGTEGVAKLPAVMNLFHHTQKFTSIADVELATLKNQKTFF
jgi:hypothetical protein